MGGGGEADCKITTEADCIKTKETKRKVRKKMNSANEDPAPAKGSGWRHKMTDERRTDGGGLGDGKYNAGVQDRRTTTGENEGEEYGGEK